MSVTIDREELIRMAREAGAGLSTSAMPLEHPWVFLPDELERFAALVSSRVAAASASVERETCAQICDSVNSYDNPMTANDVADAIRARGETSSREQP